jgi:hypothetical protein
MVDGFRKGSTHPTGNGLCLVIAGLDPAIHGAFRLPSVRWTVSNVAAQHGCPGQARA